jgi:hypothetical protein
VRIETAKNFREDAKMRTSQAKALKALGIDLNTIDNVEIRQAIAEFGINGIGHYLAEIGKKKDERLQRKAVLDGATEYQPITRPYAQKGYLGPESLKKLREKLG